MSASKHSPYHIVKSINTTNIHTFFCRTYLVTHVFLLNVALLALLSISGCRDEPRTQPPQAGEYGQKIIQQISLSKEQISMLNADDLPKPLPKQSNEQKINLFLTADSALNPYRLVIVAKGRSMAYEPINIRFAGLLSQVDEKNQLVGIPTPQIYREEDDTKYRVNQQAVLAVISEPFSFSAGQQTRNYIIQTGLTQRDNFYFETVDIQIWQGVGEKQSKYSHYKLLLVLIIVGLFIYRLFHARL